MVRCSYHKVTYASQIRHVKYVIQTLKFRKKHALLALSLFIIYITNVNYFHRDIISRTSKFVQRYVLLMKPPSLIDQLDQELNSFLKILSINEQRMENQTQDKLWYQMMERRFIFRRNLRDDVCNKYEIGNFKSDRTLDSFLYYNEKYKILSCLVVKVSTIILIEYVQILLDI